MNKEAACYLLRCSLNKEAAVGFGDTLNAFGRVFSMLRKGVNKAAPAALTTDVADAGKGAAGALGATIKNMTSNPASSNLARMQAEQAARLAAKKKPI